MTRTNSIIVLIMASPKQLLECVARYDYIILLTKSSVPLLSAAPSAAVDDKGSKGQAEVAPEVQALLLVDDDGRAFIEDANGNHVRVFINDKGETVMADENGNALMDDGGQPIMVPFSEDGKADIALLPKSQRDVVQDRGHTLSDAEPLPEAVRADLDAFELEKVVQLKTLSAFVGWCANRTGKKGGRTADNEFLDELEEVISTFRTVHVAQPWRNRAQLARITSVRVQERIDHLRTIRTTILKELDKNRTLQQLQELRNYRDPPKAAATCINAVLLILGDPNVAEFVEPALKSVPITNHPNALKSLWKMMKPVIIDTAFTGRLNACDTTGDDHETTSRCKASNFTLMQVTPQEAKRVSKVVALMRHWVELQLLIHEQALEYRRTHAIPAGKQIDIAPRAKKSLLDNMPPPV